MRPKRVLRNGMFADRRNRLTILGLNERVCFDCANVFWLARETVTEMELEQVA